MSFLFISLFILGFPISSLFWTVPLLLSPLIPPRLFFLPRALSSPSFKWISHSISPSVTPLPLTQSLLLSIYPTPFSFFLVLSFPYFALISFFFSLTPSMFFIAFFRTFLYPCCFPLSFLSSIPLLLLLLQLILRVNAQHISDRKVY